VPERSQDHARISAPVELCYAVAADVAAYPTWQKDVKAVEVLATDDDGEVVEARLTLSGLGRTVHQVLRYDHSGAPGRLAWSLVEGDLVRSLTGTYEFASDGDGTAVTYTLELDLSAPVPGILKRKVQGMIMGAALKDFRKRVEAGP
jgi:ribosome-associated toxin RatA of RatAB toxin-antitoxin module